PPDVRQLTWIDHGVDPRDQVLLDGKRQHGGNCPVAQRNDTGLAIDVSGGQSRPRVAEESHDLVGDRLPADVRLADHGQRTTDVGPSDDRRIQQWKEGFELPPRTAGDEGIDDPPLLLPIDRNPWSGRLILAAPGWPAGSVHAD